MHVIDTPISPKPLSAEMKARVSHSFEKAVHYMAKLKPEQLDALKISATTVHYLRNIEKKDMRIIKDDNTRTLQIYPDKEGNLVFRASAQFQQVNNQTLDWCMLSEIKDMDQMVKGRQPYLKTTFEDLDDKLWHKLSENELPIVHNITSGLMQVFLPKRSFMSMSTMACRLYNHTTVGPFLSALAHRIISDRCDKFATNVTGITFKEIKADTEKSKPASKNVADQPVPWWMKAFNCYPKDEKRIEKTTETALNAKAFRRDNAIPVYPL